MGGSRHGDRFRIDGDARARGLSTVAIALLTPLLILLVSGAIDASSLLIQNIDVGKAAQSGGRYAATGVGDTTAIGILVCSSVANHSSITVELAGSAGNVGDEIQITVRKEADVVTGLTDWIFDPPVNLSATSTFQLQQAPIPWTDGTYHC